jgi:hypothetical protein
MSRCASLGQCAPVRPCALCRIHRVWYLPRQPSAQHSQDRSFLRNEAERVLAAGYAVYALAEVLAFLSNLAIRSQMEAA